MDELRDILEVLKREEALMKLLDEDERLLSQVEDENRRLHLQNEALIGQNRILQKQNDSLKASLNLDSRESTLVCH